MHLPAIFYKFNKKPNSYIIFQSKISSICKINKMNYLTIQLQFTIIYANTCNHKNYYFSLNLIMYLHTLTDIIQYRHIHTYIQGYIKYNQLTIF